MIPTRSNNPTAYLPRFSPVCAPDMALKPIISLRIFHFPSFTSIQWAVIPRNPILVVSADHPSAVIDILPGANYSGSINFFFTFFHFMFNAYSYSLLQTLYVRYKLIMKMDFNIIGTRQVFRSGFRSHGNKGIAEGNVIGKRERLHVSRYVIDYQWTAI